MAEPIPLPSPQQMLALRALIIPLMRVSGLVVVLGLIFAVDVFARMLFGTVNGAVGWIPWLGNRITGKLSSLEQRFSSYLGGLESHIDVSMGGWFHNLAIVTEQLSTGWAELAIVDHFIIRKLTTTHNPAVLKPAITHATTTATIAGARAAHAHGEATTAAKVAAHAAPASVVPQTRANTHAIATTLPGEIAGLRERTKATEDKLTRAWEWIRSHPISAASGVFVGALTYALGRLGMGWARCSNVGRVGRALCGLNPNLLESLLAGAAVVVGSISIVELAKACQEFEPIAEDGAKFFVRELG